MTRKRTPVDCADFFQSLWFSDISSLMLNGIWEQRPYHLGGSTLRLGRRQGSAVVTSHQGIYPARSLRRLCPRASLKILNTAVSPIEGAGTHADPLRSQNRKYHHPFLRLDKTLHGKSNPHTVLVQDEDFKCILFHCKAAKRIKNKIG